jgi:hypothetical protein
MRLIAVDTRFIKGGESMQIEAPFLARSRFGYGAATLNTAFGDDVHLAFLRGPLTSSVLPRVMADLGVEMKLSQALSSVAFIDRCVVTASSPDFYEAMFTQVLWGRCMRPCAFVCSPDCEPIITEFASRMSHHGVILEVFTSRASFDALEWARARADSARAQATYLSRTSRG